MKRTEETLRSMIREELENIIGNTTVTAFFTNFSKAFRDEMAQKIMEEERFTEPLLIDIKEMIDEEMQEWPGGKE